MNRHQDRARIGMALAGIVFAAVMSIALGRGSAAHAQERFHVWDGVYIEEQAPRGKEQYHYTCAP